MWAAPSSSSSAEDCSHLLLLVEAHVILLEVQVVQITQGTVTLLKEPEWELPFLRSSDLCLALLPREEFTRL